MLKEINLVLEEQRPQVLIDALECFIALLRNKLAANHIDVKLYLLDNTKLQFKLRTIDAKKLSYDVVHKAIERLARINGIDSAYEPIVLWCRNFTAYSEYHLDEVKLENDKNVVKEQMAQMTNDLKVKNDLLQILNAPTLTEFYADQAPQRRMMETVEDCREKVKNNAMEGQDQY